jgi:antitoxin MazE
MKAMKTTIRPMGNSQGVIIPKPLLAQVGLESEAEMTIERGAIVLRRPVKAVREGWAADARRIAEADDDELVMGEFANADDATLAW